MIYLDQAATAFPKAPGVGQAVAQFLEQRAVNINRGSYDAAIDAAMEVYRVRQAVCRLVGWRGDARQCAFSSGVTLSLNLILQGALRPGQRLLISGMEHNAVVRTARLLAQRGVLVEEIPCDSAGCIRPDAMEAMLPGAAVAAIAHASNVTGTIQPLELLGPLCRKHGVFLVVDAAQTAGHVPIDMDGWGIAALAFSGHKGLLGPQGIGGAVLTPALFDQMTPVIAGGTGIDSASETMPRRLPEALEAGTLNLPGICGLGCALDYIERQGVNALQAREAALTAWFLAALADNQYIALPGPDAAGRVGVVSVRFLRRDNAQATARLQEEFGILTRCGLHCAPLAHRSVGTFPEGTVRFSFGVTTTMAELEAAVYAIAAVC